MPSLFKILCFQFPPPETHQWSTSWGQAVLLRDMLEDSCERAEFDLARTRRASGGEALSLPCLFKVFFPRR